MTRRDGHYEIDTIVSAPFEEISYLAWRADRDEALVVDPGFDVDAIQRGLDEHHLRLAAILNTHGHADHIAGNGALKAAYPGVPLLIGRNEAPLLTDAERNLSAPFGLPVTSPPADRLLDDGERIELAGFVFLVREIPGHSPGSVVYICEELDPPFAFVGDVLFAGSVGRTDFPGGSAAALFRGIRDKLFVLPDETLILAGHGPATTVGQEKRDNPYVGENAGSFSS